MGRRDGQSRAGAVRLAPALDDPAYEAYVSRTLLVKNLPADVTEQELLSLMAADGNVSRVTILPDATSAYVEYVGRLPYVMLNTYVRTY